MKRSLLAVTIAAIIATPGLATAGGLEDIAESNGVLWQDHHVVEYGQFKIQTPNNPLRADSTKSIWAGEWVMQMIDHNMSVLTCPIKIKNNGTIPLGNCKVSLNGGPSVGGPMTGISLKVKKGGAAKLTITFDGPAKLKSEELFFNKKATQAQGYVRYPETNQILSLTMIKVRNFTKMSTPVDSGEVITLTDAKK